MRTIPAHDLITHVAALFFAPRANSISMCHFLYLFESVREKTKAYRCRIRQIYPPVCVCVMATFFRNKTDPLRMLAAVRGRQTNGKRISDYSLRCKTVHGWMRPISPSLEIHTSMTSSASNDPHPSNEENKTTIYSMLTDQPIAIPESALFGVCR